MSYQVLARKWRPGNFDELVGQTHVLRALSSALENERLHHAYLFTGTRGVGKTTIARILARCLNCEQGIGATPCGTCSACTEINEGRFVDLIEVDAASRTKVEDTRELLDNVQYRPTRGRYKVYLIDEVHMLSNHSFNALLKTLEEPPPHVIFLLATTDPQKLPATVLSRCLQFHLKNMQPEDISKHLAHILKTEAIEFEDMALESLAWSAKGSMRDALSLLDQAIAFGNGRVFDTEVRDMLGTIDRDQIYRLLSALADNKGAECMAIVDELSQFAPDYEEVMAELLAVLHRIAMVQQIPDVNLVTQDQQQVAELAKAMSAEDVQLFYQLGLLGRRDLPMAPDKRSGFEMCLLRMMNFRPATSAASRTATGVPPVKKPESSVQTVATTAEVSGNQQKQTSKSSSTVETNDSVTSQAEIPEYTIIDTEQDEDDYSDPRDYELSQAAASRNPSDKAHPQEPQQHQQQASQVHNYLSGPLKSPLVRDRQTSTVNSEPGFSNRPVADDFNGEGTQKPTTAPEVAAKEREPEGSPVAIPVQEPVQPEVIQQPPVQEDPDIESVAKILPEQESAATEEPWLEPEITKIEQDTHEEPAPHVAGTQASPVLELPALATISQQNWHCVIHMAKVTGVTEQIALNSQFIEYTDDNVKLSLSNNIRSMLTNEHLNKLTAAINGLYNSSLTISVSEFEPEYETPRQRKERIKQERQREACDNLTSDPQVQGLLNTFGAQLDQDSVETLLTEQY